MASGLGAVKLLVGTPHAVTFLFHSSCIRNTCRYLMRFRSVYTWVTELRFLKLFEMFFRRKEPELLEWQTGNM